MNYIGNRTTRIGSSENGQGPTSYRNERHDERSAIGGDEVKKSCGQDKRPVSSHTAALVDEEELLQFRIGRIDSDVKRIVKLSSDTTQTTKKDREHV